METYSERYLVTGVKDVFIHVNTNNKVAQQLYKNIGFEVCYY
jgi:predicted GNAT family acetyltransferase